jgi:putative membrane protein
MLTKAAFAVLLTAGFVPCLGQAQSNDLSANDKDFIEFAGETDLLASRLGQLAQTRGTTPDVQTFGKIMEAHHAEELKTLAGIAGKTGGLAPNTLDDVHINTLKRVSKYKSKSFDHQFLKAVVNQHENALVSFKREADHGFNQDLQAFAKNALPKLEEHLKEAKKLDASAR